MKNFQVIVIVVFVAAAVLGVLVFSGAIPIGSDKQAGQGTVVLWGTIPASILSPLIEDFNNANPTFVLKYVQKYPDTLIKICLKR